MKKSVFIILLVLGSLMMAQAQFIGGIDEARSRSRNAKLLESIRSAEHDEKIQSARLEYLARYERTQNEARDLKQKQDAEKAMALAKYDREQWRNVGKNIDWNAVWKYRFQQASNGLPSFQFDVGTNYLAQGNTNLAKYWLEKSAQQENIQASNLLNKF